MVNVSYVACFKNVYIVVGTQDVLELHPVTLTCSHCVLVVIVWFWNQRLILQVMFRIPNDEVCSRFAMYLLGSLTFLLRSLMFLLGS